MKWSIAIIVALMLAGCATDPRHDKEGPLALADPQAEPWQKLIPNLSRFLPGQRPLGYLLFHGKTPFW